MTETYPDSPRPFHSTGLPDDFDAFMADVALEADELSDAELCELYEIESGVRFTADVLSGGMSIRPVKLPVDPRREVA